jgi:O-antigen ligase
MTHRSPSFVATHDASLIESREISQDGSREEIRRSPNDPGPSMGAYLWLVLFFVAYCARPEDWFPGLGAVPLAKIAGILCGLSFLASVPQLSRHFPREAKYLAMLVLQLWLTVPLSPVWRGGAFYTTLDFSKILLIVLVMGVAVTSMVRLRRLIFVQTAAVATAATVTILRKDLILGRLAGAGHGIYANSNELALILVLTLPLCVAFMLRTRRWWRKAIWLAAAVLMVYETMLTGSRGGLLALLVGGSVCLREFGLRGRRIGLVLCSAVVAVALILSTGDTVMDRFHATFNNQPTTENGRAAYGSAVQRQELFWKALAVTAEHPLFGIGPGNFNSISGVWHDQHNSYTQMSSEGGMPALILYVLMLACALGNLRKTNRLAPADSEEALFAMALRASLWGFMVGSFFASSAYQFFPYFLVAYSSGLVAIAETKYGTLAAEQTTDEVPEEIYGAYDEPATISFAG